jgi:hypothetical protein
MQVPRHRARVRVQGRLQDGGVDGDQSVPGQEGLPGRGLSRLRKVRASLAAQPAEAGTAVGMSFTWCGSRYRSWVDGRWRGMGSVIHDKEM